MVRTTLRATLAGWLALALALIALPSTAAPTTLNVNVDVGPAEVTVEGTLTNDRGRAVRQQVVTASVDGAVVAEDRTRGNGRFRLQFSTTSLTPGDHELVISFAGGGDDDPAQASTTLTVAGEQPAPPPPDDPVTTTPTPATAAPSQNPTPAQTATPGTPAAEATPTATLTATGPESAGNGDDALIVGTLLDNEGDGVPGVELGLLDADGVLTEAVAMTDAAGGFSLTYAVPDAQPDGPLTLTIEFDGAGTYAPAQSTVTIPVTFRPLPSPTASPSPTQTATDATATATAASATPTAERDTTTAVEDEGNPWLGLTIALVVLGGLAIIAAAALLLRGGTRRRPPHTDAEGLSFIDEEMDEEPTLFLDESPTADDDEALTQPIPVDEPTQFMDAVDETPTRPRRGLED